MTDRKKSSEWRKSMRRIIKLHKENPLVFAAWGLFMFVFLGVANSVCASFFDLCGNVFCSTTKGLWHSVVDVYYASAAKTDMSELITIPALVVLYLLLLLPWYSAAMLKRLVKKMEVDLSDATTGSEGTTKTEETDKDNLGRVKARIKRVKRKLVWIRVLNVVMSVVLVFSSSLCFYGRKKLHNFNLKLTEAGPWISNEELKFLKRDWVMMKSREDYLKLMGKVDGYLKRLDNRRQESPKSEAVEGRTK